MKTRTHRNSHMNSSILFNTKKVVTTQMSIKWWRNKMAYNHTMEHYSVMKIKFGCICFKMHDPWKHRAKHKKPGTKDHMLQGSIYVKHPHRQLHRQQGDQGLLRSEGMGRGVPSRAKGVGFLSEVMNVLCSQMNCGDGCTKLWIS